MDKSKNKELLPNKKKSANKNNNKNIKKPDCNKQGQSKAAKKKQGILFVCTGNTCRSPMAEYIFKDYLKKNKIKGYQVSSAGIAVTDNCISSHSAAVLKSLGIAVKKHTPRQITLNMINESRLIICMSKGHKDALPPAKSIVLFSQITNGGDVLDPYGQSIEQYKKVAEYFLYGCKEIIDFLNATDKMAD